VLQGQKGGTACSTTVLLTLRPRTGGHAPLHSRASLGLRDILSVFAIFWGSFGWGFQSSSVRVSLSLSQTPLGGNKVG